MEKVVASLVMEKVVAILVVWLPFHDNYTTSLFNVNELIENNKIVVKRSKMTLPLRCDADI